MRVLVLILATTLGLEVILANKTAPRSEKGMWKRDLSAVGVAPVVTTAVPTFADENSVLRDRRKAEGFKNRRLYRKSSSSSSSSSASVSVSKSSSEEKGGPIKYILNDYDPALGYDYGPKLQKRPPPPGRPGKRRQHHPRLDEYGNEDYELY